MTAQIIEFRDYQSRAAIDRAHKALEEHLAKEALSIAGQLWLNDAGTIGIPFAAPEKDPA